MSISAKGRAVIRDGNLATWVRSNGTPQKRNLTYEVMAVFGFDVWAIAKRIRNEQKQRAKRRGWRGRRSDVGVRGCASSRFASRCGSGRRRLRSWQMGPASE